MMLLYPSFFAEGKNGKEKIHNSFLPILQLMDNLLLFIILFLVILFSIILTVFVYISVIIIISMYM